MVNVKIYDMVNIKFFSLSLFTPIVVLDRSQRYMEDALLSGEQCLGAEQCQLIWGKVYA